MYHIGYTDVGFANGNGQLIASAHRRFMHVDCMSETHSCTSSCDLSRLSIFLITRLLQIIAKKREAQNIRIIIVYKLANLRETKKNENKIRNIDRYLSNDRKPDLTNAIRN